MRNIKTSNISKFIAAGIALAGIALIPNLHAAVELVVDGANSTRTLLFDVASNILSGYTVYTTSANTRSYVGGTLIAAPALGTVNIHFAQNGATLGLQRLRDQTSEPLAYTSNGTSNAPPQLAISAAQPEVVSIDPSLFNSSATLVNPFGYAINTNLSPNLAGFTNVTQRQLAYLEGASGTLPSAFFGGSST